MGNAKALRLISVESENRCCLLFALDAVNSLHLGALGVLNFKAVVFIQQKPVLALQAIEFVLGEKTFLYFIRNAESFPVEHESFHALKTLIVFVAKAIAYGYTLVVVEIGSLSALQTVIISRLLAAFNELVFFFASFKGLVFLRTLT